MTKLETEKLKFVRFSAGAWTATWNDWYSPRAAEIRTVLVVPDFSVRAILTSVLGTVHTIGLHMANIGSRLAESARNDTREEALSKIPAYADPERLVSLDVFRGFTMFWIVGGGMLALGLSACGSNFILDSIVRQLDHTPWIGLRFYDCIWPCFMLMVGISVPLSLAKRSLHESYHRQLKHAVQRAIVLFLLGSVRESISLGSPYWIELSSALQPIAIAYLVAFLVARRSWRFQASLAGIILAVYACVLAFVAAPGIAAGSYAFNHNLVHTVDIAVLGQRHWDIWPYRDEGWGTVLVIIPAIATTLFGLLIGELLLTSRTTGSKVKIIGGMGVGFLAAGFGLSPVIPIEMKMWTISYGLASAGVACLEFLFFFWLVDIARRRKWSIVFLPFGMNAIFIYMLTSVVSIRAGTDIFTHPVAVHLGRGGLLFEAMGAMAVEWVILYWMMKRRIFIKI
jgi:predicted acyltransferase